MVLIAFASAASRSQDERRASAVLLLLPQGAGRPGAQAQQLDQLAQQRLLGDPAVTVEGGLCYLTPTQGDAP
jgi:hypothetical protein